MAHLVYLSIIQHNDKWNNVCEVNSCLKKMCGEADMKLLDHSNTKNSRRH